MSENTKTIDISLYGCPVQCKRCSKCKQWKPRSEFNKTKSNKDGLDYWCRECRHQYKVKNKLRIKEYDREYNKQFSKTDIGRFCSQRSAHIRRAREKNVKYGDTLNCNQWNNILKLQNYRCNICGIKFSDKVKPEKDHILPISKNGCLSSYNIQALCTKCNRKKSAKIDLNYIQSWFNDR